MKGECIVEEDGTTIDPRRLSDMAAGAEAMVYARLRTMGWSDEKVRDPESDYGRMRPALVKRYTDIPFGLHMVTGTATLFLDRRILSGEPDNNFDGTPILALKTATFRNLYHMFSGPIDDSGRNVNLFWKTDDKNTWLSHPHAGRQGWLCHSARFTANMHDEGERRRYFQETLGVAGLAAVYANAVDGAPLVFNLGGVADHTWQRCRRCLQVINVNATHDCQPLPQAFERLTTRFRSAVLVGAGVTGSWIAQALVRSADHVTVFDHDRVRRDEHAGRWNAPRTRRELLTYKASAVVEAKYRGKVSTVRRAYALGSRRQVEQPPDLFVLAADSVHSRDRVARDIGLMNRFTARWTWMLDVRVTLDQVVCWAVRVPSGDILTRYLMRDYPHYWTWKTTLTDNETGIQRCGDRDNVPMVGGMLAAAFVGWWTTREPSEMKEGVWTLDMNRPWFSPMEDEPAPAPQPSLRRAVEQAMDEIGRPPGVVPHPGVVIDSIGEAPRAGTPEWAAAMRIVDTEDLDAEGDPGQEGEPA